MISKSLIIGLTGRLPAENLIPEVWAVLRHLLLLLLLTLAVVWIELCRGNILLEHELDVGCSAWAWDRQGYFVTDLVIFKRLADFGRLGNFSAVYSSDKVAALKACLLCVRAACYGKNIAAELINSVIERGVVRIDINKGRGHNAELNSDRSLKLFEEVILQQFYDRFSQSALTIEELKEQIKVYKLADQKRALRTMHEMYKAFVDKGYLSFNNDKDLYMLGQKNHKYVTTNNGVTDWIYAVFAYLSKRYAVDTTEDERRKTVRDNLKRYTKVYHQDDAIFPVYDFEHLKRVYVASDINEDAGISWKQPVEIAQLPYI